MWLKGHLTSKKLKIEERANVIAPMESFVSLKDHKANFRQKPTVRLLNPAKTDMGRVSKTVLDNIIQEVRRRTKLPLWTSTGDVIEWFERLEDKK